MKRKKENSSWIDERTGLHWSYPWPADIDEKRHLVKNSIGPLAARWAEGQLTESEFEQFGPGLVDPIVGGPLTLTDHQRRLLILYYAYDADTGRWLYRAPARSDIANDRILTAVLATIEDVGPSRLAWDDGGWIAQPRARCRFPAMLSEEGKAWHGVARG